MELEKVFNTIEKSYEECENRDFLVDGGERKRLFISSDYKICEFVKGSTKRGYRIQQTIIDSWQKLEPVNTIETINKKCYKNLEKIIYYLEKSGLWCNLLKTLKSIHDIEYEDFCKLLDCTWEEQEKMFSLGFAYDLRTILKKGIKNIQYDEKQIAGIADIEYSDNRDFTYSWIKKYDYSVHFNPNEKKGWYSEEYHNCGNGHYYIALDFQHALFIEND